MARFMPLWVIAVVATAPVASAKCAPRAPYLAPASGAVLPSRPTVYLFVPHDSGQPLTLEARDESGSAVRLQVREIARSEALATYALTVDQITGGHVVLRHGDEELAHYSISPSQTSMHQPARPTAAKHARSRWGCSHTDARHITLSGNAPAYRVERSPEPEAIGGAATEVTIHAGDVAMLGYLDCMGLSTAEPVDGVFYVRVTPLYPDGPGPTSATFGVSETDVWLVTPPAEQPRHVCGVVAPRQTPADRFPWGLLLVIGTLAGFAVFGLIARSRRQPTRTAL